MDRNHRVKIDIFEKTHVPLSLGVGRSSDSGNLARSGLEISRSNCSGMLAAVYSPNKACQEVSTQITVVILYCKKFVKTFSEEVDAVLSARFR